jgi:hypothetical protein
MKTLALIVLLFACSFALDKYTIPYAASDTMTKAQFNSNHDTTKAYIDKVIDTINLNIPRYTQNANTHDKTVPYINIDTLNVDTVAARAGTFSGAMSSAGTASVDSLNKGSHGYDRYFQRKC